MLLLLALALIILWGLGAFVFTSVGSIVHFLLVLAVIVIIVHFVLGSRAGGGTVV